MARKSSKGSSKGRSQRRQSGGKRAAGKSGGSGARPNRKRKNSQPALSFRALAGIWFAAGVALGLLILVPIYFASGGGESPREPGQQRASAPETPDYQFYDILPHTRVRPPRPDEPADKPESPESEPDKAAPAEEPPPVPEDGTYFLQVASFKKAEDADGLKARLALKGLEAKVVSARIPGKGTWHRVRLGPFEDPRRLQNVEGQLREAGIRAMRVESGG
jgi:hypothetical protein